MLTLKQFTGSLVTPTDDALFYDFLISGQCGIFEGCEVTHLGANQLRVSSGRGVILGRIFTVEEETIQAAVSPGGEVDGRLLIRVDVANGEKPIEFVTQAETPLPELTQEDINRDGSVYELPLAVYKVTELLISGLASVTAKPRRTASWLYNAEAVRSGTTVAIAAPAGAEIITFIAPADWTAGDNYTVNGNNVTLSGVTGEVVEDCWKQGSPVQLMMQGNKAFFRQGGGSSFPDTLPPLSPNFEAKRAQGENKVIVTADQFVLSDETSMIGGASWCYGEVPPIKLDRITEKKFTREQLVASGDVPAKVSYEVEWPKEKSFYARQFTHNLKGQYQTMLPGAIAAADIYLDPILKNNSPKNIIYAAENGLAKTLWHIGDEIDIPIGGVPYTFVIVAFGADNITDTAKQAGITFGMKNLWNSSISLEYRFHYESSGLASYVNDNVFPEIPEEWRNGIKSVDKRTAYASGMMYSKVEKLSLKLFPFSIEEVVGEQEIQNDEGSDIAKSEGPNIYEYFKTASNLIKAPQSGGGAKPWVLRSAAWSWGSSSNPSPYCLLVTETGKFKNTSGNSSANICIGFCV